MDNRPRLDRASARTRLLGKASFFEDHCRDKGLELVVVPPKRAALSGYVERAQSSWRYEFYASYDLPARIDKLQPLVEAFAHRFNHHRPLAISPQSIETTQPEDIAVS